MAGKPTPFIDGDIKPGIYQNKLLDKADKGKIHKLNRKRDTNGISIFI